MSPEQKDISREYLRTEEAAELLRMSVQYLSIARFRGEGGPPYIKIGRAVRYRRSSLIEWAQSLERRPQ